MSPFLQALLSIVLGFLGLAALWSGSVESGGPDGGGPRHRIQGSSAKMIGALLVAAAIGLCFSATIGLLLFLLAAAIASVAYSRR